MDLAMILNDDGDDAASPGPSPAPSPQASTRWSVDEMRHAVAILSDLPAPAARAHDVDDDETEDELDLRARARQPAPQQQPPATQPAAFSGLDLLFQADAMIQKRESPEMHPAKAPKKAKKPAKQTRKARVADEDDDDPDDDDDDQDTNATPSSSPKYLRSGFWTRAEEEYAAALIFYFHRGALPIAEGTTLRKYLAEQLCCNRRRVSMKLATETIADKKIPRKVGASVFVSLKPAPSDADRQEVVEVLDRLRRECFREMNDETDKTPRQGSSSAKEPVSPLVLGSKGLKNGSRSPVELSLATPARRKSRRPSVASNPKASPPPHVKRRHPTIIRTGFDSPEEEEFATALVEYFIDGVLELRDDTRLVTYLCEQLECSAKTLSMKLAPRKMGEHKFPENIGSITYSRKDDDDSSSEIFEAEAHVFELRQNWLQAREDARAQAEADTNGEDDEEEDVEEKASVASSPVSTPSRRVKAEPSGSSSTPSSKSPNNAPRSYSRSGPWSRHEEEYAAGLIDCFFRGVLDITEGTTLRAFLTSRLNCNPMRISKKLASHTIADVKIPKKLGSATYVRRDGVSNAERQSAEEHLRHLEHKSLSEQHLKEDIVMGVIGNKHTREDHDQPLAERRFDSQYSHQQTRRHYSDSPSPVRTAGVTPASPFKMRRIVVDDYSAPHDQHHHHAHRSSPPGAYDHHDAAMRYQRVAY